MRRLGAARALVLGIVLILAPTTAAVGQYLDSPLSDPVFERRAQELHKQIRCLVCQNQAIADSNATLARQLREIVRERLAAGDSDDEVQTFLVARYGNWVLMRPPLNTSTVLLWGLPFAILAAVLAGVAVFLWRRKGRAVTQAPLDDEEKAQLASILDRPH